MKSVFEPILKILFLAITLTFISNCQKIKKDNDITSYKKLDAIFDTTTSSSFNGIVLISQNGKQQYLKIQGYSDIEKKIPLKLEDQFVIGSISKQITVVLILQAYERGEIKLDVPIGNYLPALKTNWKDSITVHHLLTHTHGISSLDAQLSFKPGTQFQYSQIGYELLANILASVTNQSFENLATNLFQKHEMKHSFHPHNKQYKNLVKGHKTLRNQSIAFEENSFRNYVPAGSFISNATDLTLWNDLLHGGQLLKDTTFRLMTTRYATRKHPIYNELEYSYGLLFKKGESQIQIGALGYAPGFVSANYFFPKTKTSIVILENLTRNLNDIKQVFHYHTNILNAIKQEAAQE